MTNGPAKSEGQARLGLSKSQRSEKLGSTERDVTVPGTELPFFSLFFFPGLEIIGLQSEIRRKGNNQKRNQFEQRQVAGLNNTHCCDRLFLLDVVLCAGVGVWAGRGALGTSSFLTDHPYGEAASK